MEYLWTVKIYYTCFSFMILSIPSRIYLSTTSSRKKSSRSSKWPCLSPLDPFAKILSKGQINFSPALYVSDMPHPVGNRYSHVEIVKL